MRQSTIAKIKNGKITLPKSLQKEWWEGEVLFMPSAGGFLIKSITPPSLTTIAAKLRKAAKSAGITPSDVKKAVAWARKKTYEGRA